MNRRLLYKPGIMRIIRRTKDYGMRSLDLLLMRTICSIMLILGLSVISIQALIGIQQAELDKFVLDNLVSSATFITFLTSVAIFLALLLIMKLYKTIVVSQFQSMIFSTAMRQDSLLCIIIDQNLEVIYVDDSARAILTAGSTLTENNFKFDLDQLFDQGKIDIYNKQQFLKSIKESSSFSVKHTLITSGASNIKLVLTKVDPLARPKNFFLIKSYEIQQQQQ